MLELSENVIYKNHIFGETVKPNLVLELGQHFRFFLLITEATFQFVDSFLQSFPFSLNLQQVTKKLL